MRRSLRSCALAVGLGLAVLSTGVAGAAAEGGPAVTPDFEKGQAEAQGVLSEADRLLAAGDAKEAREQYERAMPMLPRELQPQVHRQLARTHYESGDRRAAVAQVEQALAIDPEDPDTLALMVSLLAEQGRVGEAQSFARRMPDGAPLDASASMNMGIALQRAGDPRAAFAQFDRAVREHPREADAYFYRGQAALALGDHARAAADYEMLIAIAPAHPRAHEARALVQSLRAR
jgi:tetratricopeptide (TPR) repeat protein